MIEFLIAIQIKHFVFDFPLQGPYQYKNKGTFGHPGGILHAGLHAFATWWIVMMFVPDTWLGVWLACAIATTEFVLHYLIDWAKMNLNDRYGLKPDNSEKFWWLLGLDQLAHQLCYVAMFAVLF